MIIKLSFLLRVITNDDTLSSRIFRALAVSEVESLHLIRQCRFLESSFETSIVLSTPDETSIYQLKKEINRDWLSLLSAAAKGVARGGSDEPPLGG